MVDTDPYQPDHKCQQPFEYWLGQIDGENAHAVARFMDDNDHRDRIAWAPGSRDAHHAWEGGYQEHLRQTMLIAAHNYELFTALGRMEELSDEEKFSLSDALTVMFLHDIEKPFIYDFDTEGGVVKVVDMPKQDRKSFRQAMVEQYGFVITPTMENGLLYVEGVRDESYIPGERADQPLAALCHAADNLSARGFYSHRGSI